jgi:hypothetical protein
MQDSGRLSGGDDLRRAVNAIRDAPRVPAGEIRDRPIAAFSNPWANLGGGRERMALHDVLVLLPPVALAASALLAAAGILSLLGAAGPALVTALDIGPGLSAFPGAE